MLNEILFLILAFFSAIVSGTFGIGSGIILIPFSAFLLPIKKAIAIITIFFIASNIAKIILFHKHIDWKKTLLIWIGAVPFVFIGATLMVISPTAIIEKILGIIIILYVINEYFQLTAHIKLKKHIISFIGGLYGFSGGIIGTGGPIKAALLTHLGLRKEKFIATMAASGILINFIKTFIYSKSSLVGFSDIRLIIGLIIVAFAGAYTGKHLVKRVRPEIFKKAILLLLLIASTKLLIF